MEHWFEPLADHLGAAYLRYSFTKGTHQEVDFLVEHLQLSPATRVLDVGCGPGRHAHELASRGIPVHGVDISQRFVDLARETSPRGATFERSDARDLAYDQEFDAVVCLCQGGFGLMTEPGDDEAVVAGMARSVRLGGRLALSAFSSYFVVRHWAEAEFDPQTGVNRELTVLADEAGTTREAELWTGCYTPRELRLIAGANGLRVDAIYSATPGDYRAAPASLDSEEWLMLATRTA